LRSILYKLNKKNQAMLQNIRESRKVINALARNMEAKSSVEE
jgi:hypothetical protein